jgi:hypothetical protein
MAAELSLGEGPSILPYLRGGSRPRGGATVRRHERFDGERTRAVVAQERSVADGDTIRSRRLMTDIPPPDDVHEQHQEVVEEEQDDVPTSDPEAPEADALEQAQTVPGDDEEEMRG